jgi:hypothetical protein
MTEVYEPRLKLLRSGFDFATRGPRYLAYDRVLVPHQTATPLGDPDAA